jgi:glycosyltransferase involved in cell wall biosynthesis
MMHLFLNGLAASAGGGLTYLRNVVPHLAARGDVWTTIAVPTELQRELGDLPNISFAKMETPAGTARRFWREQTVLPREIRASGADVLISAGNFALRKSPVPQILLSRNSLYTSPDFFRDLRARGEYGMWLDTRARGVLAKRSMHWAERTVAPSKAFAEELRAWAGVDVVPIHHGFDRDIFFRNSPALPAAVQQKLDSTGDALRLLFVSHYTYYRNFATLLRALPLIKSALSPRKVRLILTCEFRANKGYRADREAALVHELRVSGEVIELGAVPYRSLSHLYRACDVYVTPAYTETFAHPLVEAMSSGLPVVASDLAVHREICGPAALYFQRFSPQELAARVTEVAGSSEICAQMVAKGTARAQDFSWSKHVDEIVTLAGSLCGAGVPPTSTETRPVQSVK